VRNKLLEYVCNTDQGAPYPRFPAKFRGFRELHAPFLDERRTHGCIQGSVQEIRGISRPFLVGRCGKFTDLPRETLHSPRKLRTEICQFPTSPRKRRGEIISHRLDLLFSFAYSTAYACSALPQILRRVLQEVRPRRISRNRWIPCQLHICSVLAVWREEALLAL
jgi:hypothetical protein